MTDSKKPDTTTAPEDHTDNPRRQFLKLSASSGVALASGALAVGASGTAAADDFNPGDIDPSIDADLLSTRRAGAAANLRIQAANQQRQKTFFAGTQFDNDDETRYENDNYYASFTKCLPHDNFGEVDPAAFEALVAAMRSGAQADFDAIPLDPTAGRKLANPQGAFKYELEGIDSHATRMEPSHTFRGTAIAGEQAEVYWQALTRDVPFSEYGVSMNIANAVADLNNLTSSPGPTDGGLITPDTLFRGETPGDLIGPYISQFLWQPFSFGPVDVVQQYAAGLSGVDFMIDEANWLNVQRGGSPLETINFGAKRYINDNRALSEYVHRDVTYQAYLHACLILLSYGPSALDPGNPYRSAIANQGNFTALGGPHVIDMVGKAGNLSLTGAWFQKWRVHRFLRPEALGGRVHMQLTGQRTYELNHELLNSAAVAETFSRNGTYFCPQAYTEGSPTHPSYPAGHATIAGACVTVLKAFFDESFVIPNPVVSTADGSTLDTWTGDTLTVGNELNKLANNVAIGRDAAGVHYRQDGIEGLATGEQQAIALLQDQSRTLNEDNFDGFTLTRFDGVTINIKNGVIGPG
ncbi:MAG: vanadium-dependent haloperoxidase [Pseudomonadota bacterium]